MPTAGAQTTGFGWREQDARAIDRLLERINGLDVERIRLNKRLEAYKAMSEALGGAGSAARRWRAHALAEALKVHAARRELEEAERARDAEREQAEAAAALLRVEIAQLKHSQGRLLKTINDKAIELERGKRAAASEATTVRRLTDALQEQGGSVRELSSQAQAQSNTIAQLTAIMQRQTSTAEAAVAARAAVMNERDACLEQLEAAHAGESAAWKAMGAAEAREREAEARAGRWRARAVGVAVHLGAVERELHEQLVAAEGVKARLADWAAAARKEQGPAAAPEEFVLL